MIFYIQKHGTLFPLYSAHTRDSALAMIEAGDAQLLRYTDEAVLINPLTGAVNFSTAWDDDSKRSGILCPALYCIVSERWHPDLFVTSEPYAALCIDLWLGRNRQAVTSDRAAAIFRVETHPGPFPRSTADH